jgi:hypothetical protein
LDLRITSIAVAAAGVIAVGAFAASILPGRLAVDGAVGAPTTPSVTQATSASASTAPLASRTPVGPEPADLAAPAVSDAITLRFYAARLVEPGTTRRSDEGTLTVGRVVEGSTIGLGDLATFREGSFRVDVSVFTPARDMPGQRVGFSYVTAAWSVSKPDATTVRHSSGVLNGTMTAETAFDPTSENGTITAVARMPAGPTIRAASGTFTGSERLEGQMLLVADRSAK